MSVVRVICLICLFGAAITASAADFNAYFEPSALGKIDWDAGVIYGVGKASLAQNKGSKTQALKAARALAFQSVVKLAANLKLNDHSTLQDFQQGTFIVHLQAFIRAAEPLSSTLVETQDPYIEVTYKVPLHGVTGINANILQHVGLFEAPPKAPPPPPPVKAENAVWLVLDARGVTGKTVTPALFPKIVSTHNTVVYQINPSLNQAALVNHGMARYVVSNAQFDASSAAETATWAEHILSLLISEAHAKKKKRKRQRYIVKNVKDIDGLYQTNLVVSLADAKAIKQANLDSGVLQQTRVVIVVSSAIGGIQSSLETMFGTR